MTAVNGAEQPVSEFDRTKRAAQALFQATLRAAYNDKGGPRKGVASALAFHAVRAREVRVLQEMLFETWTVLNSLDPGQSGLTQNEYHRRVRESYETALAEMTGRRIEVAGAMPAEPG